ncbi:MAG: pyruvate formate-lyase [Clostridia bacterium]|nr:pyruvate formate-lyase [Clostridia bacterium]
MTEHTKKLLEYLQKGDYRKERVRGEIDVSAEARGRSELRRDALLFRVMLENETPGIFPYDLFGFRRSRTDFAFYTDDSGKRNAQWSAGNLTPDYPRALALGMDGLRADLLTKKEADGGAHGEFYAAALETVDAALSYADRYRDFAEANAPEPLFRALCRVPRQKPESFYEACVFLQFIIFTLRCNRNTHLGLGRFDQYMLPFWRADVRKGVPEETLFETLEEFFISQNFDTDLYQGMQLGDNGQSLMLGGYDLDGNDRYNELSDAVMRASLELRLIDPKINLRVGKKTPADRFILGTRMTRQGLGFPQYSNDDVVIPGLIRLGYAPEDAADYTVAACWEFTIPGKGAEIVNIDQMVFPKVVRRELFAHLEESETFEDLLEYVKLGVAYDAGEIVGKRKGVHYPASPYLSVLIEGCAGSGKDVSEYGAKYNNFGAHGVGIANAADSLAAVREVIYEKRECTKRELLQALEKNFEGYGKLRNRLLSCPKMGSDDDRTDGLAQVLLETYAAALNGKPNDAGGVFRAGTGSAHEYYYSARNVGATPDGRKAGEMYGSGFSPSLTGRPTGPLSCIRSFTKFDMTRLVNGGPLSMELHDSVFRDEDGIEKVAGLVTAFIRLGGHQLQLNSVNRDVLLDAQAHPEAHRDLIVRVWGWSGYFVELDRQYQEHILRRTEFLI